MTDKEKKGSNPKDSVGIRKVPASTVPSAVVLEVGLAMLEGARKYGRHNYRAIGVRGSVYFDAAFRHLMSWWEGEDIDPDSRLSHVTKAIATLMVLRDGMINGNWTDDRPPKMNAGWVAELNKKAGEIIDKYPDPPEPYTNLNDPRRGEWKEFLQRHTTPVAERQDDVVAVVDEEMYYKVGGTD